MYVEDAKILQFPKLLDERGNLSFIEENNHIPFTVERTYWIYDVPGGEHRGGHSYIKNKELIIALSGSLDVVVDDGVKKKVFSLNRSYYGLYIPNGMWRHLENFSTNALAFIVSSTIYNEADYIRDYELYLSSKNI